MQRQVWTHHRAVVQTLQGGNRIPVIFANFGLFQHKLEVVNDLADVVLNIDVTQQQFFMGFGIIAFLQRAMQRCWSNQHHRQCVTRGTGPRGRCRYTIEQATERIFQMQRKSSAFPVCLQDLTDTGATASSQGSSIKHSLLQPSPSSMSMISRLRNAAMGTPLLLFMISAAQAHDGHSHPLGGVPLWQIVVVVCLALGVYIGLRAWWKRRSNRDDNRQIYLRSPYRVDW